MPRLAQHSRVLSECIVRWTSLSSLSPYQSRYSAMEVLVSEGDAPHRVSHPHPPLVS